LQETSAVTLDPSRAIDCSTVTVVGQRINAKDGNFVRAGTMITVKDVEAHLSEPLIFKISTSEQCHTINDAFDRTTTFEIMIFLHYY
jgi:hypothetical protein